MCKKALTVAGINFRNIKVTYIITGVTLLAMLANDIVFFILDSTGVLPMEGEIFGFGNVLYLLVILSAIFIPARNFKRIMNLGGKRADFFIGGAATHAIMAALVSFAVLLLYYTYETAVMARYGSGTINVVYVFGWLENGPIVAFFRQFAFLFLFASVIHTLTAAQDAWYGWAASILIVAIISVFSPIAPLRASLVWFFNLIIFHESALLQILACLALGCAVYMLNKPILARKVL